MHCSQRVKTGGHVVQNDPGAFRKRLQLSHRRRLDDIEDTKKYKARKKRFPRERHSDQSHQLARDLIDHHELRIFYPGTARDLRRRRNADQRDQRWPGRLQSVFAGPGASAWRKRRPQQHGGRRSPGPRPRPQPSDPEKRGDQRGPRRSSGRCNVCRRDAGATVRRHMPP